jgi:hypothetical protein
MASVTWTQNSIEEVVAAVQVVTDQFMGDAEEIVQESVVEAAAFQAQALEDAVTPTGERRAALGGGSPGRHLTGHMIDEITTDVTVDGNTVTGTWGWDDPESYILQQEHGSDDPRVPAADSLATSFIPARESFYARILNRLKTF